MKTVSNAKLQAMLGADQGPAPHIPQPKPSRSDGGTHAVLNVCKVIVAIAGVYTLGLGLGMVWGWLR